jgi:hypothetical protein
MASEVVLQVLRNGRQEDKLRRTGDPDNREWLGRVLTDWLEGGRWDPALWGQFTITTLSGAGRLVEVRAA